MLKARRPRILAGISGLFVLVWSAGVVDAQTPGKGMAAEPLPEKVRGLSAEEIRGLREGEGMGLARAAELNGYPGPAHVLEAAQAGKLHLYAEQRQAIERIHAKMQAEAQGLGRQILAREADLEAGFRKGQMKEEDLARRVGEIGRNRAALRLAHLRAHLMTTAILRPEQIEDYYMFRGLSAEPVQRQHGD